VPLGTLHVQMGMAAARTESTVVFGQENSAAARLEKHVLQIAILVIIKETFPVLVKTSAARRAIYVIGTPPASRDVDPLELAH